MVRSVGVVQRKARAEKQAFFADAEAPPYYTLAYTDVSKKQLQIHTGASPPPDALAYGLLLHPRTSFELALKEMVTHGTLAQAEAAVVSRVRCAFVDIGDGTDQRIRNICLYGARLIETSQTETITKPTPIFPWLLFYGKESKIRDAELLLNELKADFLHTIWQLMPGKQEVQWDGSGAHASDSKWLWCVLGVKGMGEASCYACEVPRSDYGLELGHPNFHESSLHDLGCRYLTSLFELHLHVRQREQSGAKAWTMGELEQAHHQLTAEHGSVRLPSDFAGNATAHRELMMFLATDLLGITAPFITWDQATIDAISSLYASLLVGDSQLRKVPVPQLSGTKGYSLKN